MTDKKIIRGSGGPPPAPPNPTRAPDTLNSRQFASIQDLLSEGEIEGFATPSKLGLTKGSTAYNNAALKDIFLDNTPILQDKADNTNPEASFFNFSNVEFTPRFGESNQQHIAGIVSSQIETIVDVIPRNPLGTLASGQAGGNAVTREIADRSPLPNPDAIKVTISFAQLQKATDTGDLLGSSVHLTIQVEYNNGGFTDVISDIITGRTADRYDKEYRINITGAFPVNIKVVRNTKDSQTSQLVDEFSFRSFTQIFDTKERYLNSAYTHLRLDSEQFSSVPKRAFRIRGIKIRIPAANSTGTPQVVANQAKATELGLGPVSSFGFIHYPDGYIFQGTMAAATWCSDPSMVLLDLLTNQRYGFGTEISPDQSSDSKIYENIDLYSYVAASRYASELIDNGFEENVKEPRFSCNVNIQSPMEAYELINELAGVMRCFPIWSEGSITLSRDAPTDSSYLFSLANVGENGFSYSGSSLKQRHSLISVSYFNMDSREVDFEIFEDTDATANLGGIVKKDVKAFACTSRGQAQRLGKAILFSEQNESEIVSFTTSIDAGSILRVGSVISITDPVRQGARRSGRIASATTTQITVDDTQGLDTFTGANQKVSVMMPNGTVEQKDCSVSGSNINISSGGAFSVAPNPNSIWLLESDGVGQEPQTFRVISIEEQDGINYAITALTFVAGKYDNIEKDIALPERRISLLNAPVEPPSDLKVVNGFGEEKEMLVVINALAVTKLLLAWRPVTGVSQYLVQYRFENTNWVSQTVLRPDFELIGTEAGKYEFKVFSFNAALQLSATSSNLTFNAVGKTQPPADVKNLTLEPINNKLVRLRWSRAVDPDVLHGGRVYVRHSNVTDGSGTFQNSVDLVTALAGNSTDVVVASLEGEYILKFQDDQGNFSEGEASVIQDLPDTIDAQVILEDREDLDTPPFAGLDLNTTFSNTTSALQLTDPSVVKTGTYSQTNKIITITTKDASGNAQAHGISVGELLPIRFAGGKARSGEFIIATVPTTSTLTVVADQGILPETTGNVTIDRGKRGEYNFASILDLGAVFSLELKRVIRSVGFIIGQDIETIIPNDPPEDGGPPDGGWDNYATDNNFDGIAADEANCQIQVASTNTAPSNGSTYQASDFANKTFNNFANGTFKGRGFKFKIILETTNSAQNMNVQQAGYTAQFETRSERKYQTGGGNTSTAPQQSGTAAKNIVFGTPFFTGTSQLGGSTDAFLPSIGITIQDAIAGDFFTLTNVSGTGFTLNIKNGSNFVDRKFTFQAVGYGKGV